MYEPERGGKNERGTPSSLLSNNYTQTDCGTKEEEEEGGYRKDGRRAMEEVFFFAR